MVAAGVTARARIVEWVPAAPLDRLVRLWSCEAPQAGPGLERSLPTGELALFVNLEEDQQRWYDRDARRCHRNAGAVLGGARSHPYLIDGAASRRVVGATFLAGGARPFFAMPIDALRGEHLALDAAWGHAGRSLRERLLEAPTTEARMRVLETILRERLVGPPERLAAVDFALACVDDPRRNWRIAEVQDRLGWTATRFIRVFAEQVGLTPKRFARVRRFHRAVAGLARAAPGGLAELARACGYFDQAHFIHEFRGFAGVTPSGFAAPGALPIHRRIDSNNDGRNFSNPARS